MQHKGCQKTFCGVFFSKKIAPTSAGQHSREGVSLCNLLELHTKLNQVLGVKFLRTGYGWSQSTGPEKCCNRCCMPQVCCNTSVACYTSVAPTSSPWYLAFRGYFISSGILFSFPSAPVPSWVQAFNPTLPGGWHIVKGLLASLMKELRSADW